jgi:hypothetical protein
MMEKVFGKEKYVRLNWAGKLQQAWRDIKALGRLV